MKIKGAKNILVLRIFLIFILFSLIIFGWLIWFTFKYPAHAGYLDYETYLQQELNFTEAQQVLWNHNYSCTIDNTSEDYPRPFLQINDYSHRDSTTHMTLYIEENGEISIGANRVIEVHFYVVAQDLYKIEKEQQKIAEEDVRKLVDILELQNNGTFWYRDEIDSLDYFTPTTIFYIMIFGHLPIVILLTLAIIIVKDKRQIPRPSDEPSFHSEQVEENQLH